MSDETEDSKQCRICLDGEDPTLGRLIRPCLCKGSISYVHVKCLQMWRNTSDSRSAFYACPQCGYHYHFARTRVLGIATNPIAIAALSTFFFTVLVFLSSFVSTWFMGDRQNESYLVDFYYPLDIFRGLVRMTIDFFDGDLLGDPFLLRRGSGSQGLPEPRGPPGLFARFVHRLLLGLPVVGAGSVAHMLLATPMTFQWRMRARRVGRQSRDTIALVVLFVVILGALRALYKVYRFTERMTKRILLRAEDAILEVG
ncbi:hypothetical protein C8Q78DRAFT_1037825 [Trametes maxima]|nr:hypothetical protein C8Q78DRAFT_1037825 [Trametes maxima]